MDPNPAQEANPDSDWTPIEATVELPVPNGAGVRLRTRIRAIPLGDIAQMYEVLSSIRGELTASERSIAKDMIKENKELRNKLVEESDRYEAALVRAGTIKPTFSFAVGEPGVLWQAQHPDNRAAHLAAITDLSGLRLPPEAQALLTFRYLWRGGARVGEPADGSLRTPEDAARAAGDLDVAAGGAEVPRDGAPSV